MGKRFFQAGIVLSIILLCSPVFGPMRAEGSGSALDTFNPAPPANPVRLIFIHHSTGENWLSDENGGLGMALRDNNYRVSDTNYGWGPDAIGDRTDIGNWWEWFRGPNSSTFLSALYNEGDQHASYSRLPATPSGENEIIMFKSCFPNSALQGNPNDPVPPIANNPLRGEGSGSEYHTVANAKGIYIDLLDDFRTRQDKLFVVIAAPPLRDRTYADNARAFNQWLVNEWLQGYPHLNVFVFDFYNVLTSNGGNRNTNDLGRETGNHHRWWNNAIQHKTDGGSNTSAYPSSNSDDHPTQAGNLKATGEFVSLLNIAYHLWKGEVPPAETVSTPSTPSGPESGVPGDSCSYITGGAASTLGHPIQYQFDWSGDGSDLSDWGSSAQPKTWDSEGTYYVRARARCQNDPSVVSPWSEPLTVSIVEPVPLPDLTGEWVSLAESCKRGKCKLTGSFNVRNVGEIGAPASSVGFYLSEDDAISEDDTPLKQFSAGRLKAGAAKGIRLSINLPAGVTASAKYVIAVVDSQDAVPESEEGNNQIAYGPLP